MSRNQLVMVVGIITFLWRYYTVVVGCCDCDINEILKNS